MYAEVVGHGEVWSARLMSAVLNQQGLPAAWLDAREFLRAERAAHRRLMKGFRTRCCNSYWYNIPGKRLVVTGFISRNNAGENGAAWA
ncbi:bifunctional aspartokinase/homoserine dehydrogenase II] [Escherichia coli]|uniref:Bifunctional aspartokinase/homoserine dehydrogenase II] n=1 Tax=Escherichia coli TaxID=562 RepID=A0A376WBV0_ECOLX|nr:bifunctional aspartokinase/homoserine dehydrogenase II] [Escherichia coli]